MRTFLFWKYCLNFETRDQALYLYLGYLDKVIKINNTNKSIELWQFSRMSMLVVPLNLNRRLSLLNKVGFDTVHTSRAWTLDLEIDRGLWFNWKKVNPLDPSPPFKEPLCPPHSTTAAICWINRKYVMTAGNRSFLPSRNLV